MTKVAVGLHAFTEELADVRLVDHVCRRVEEGHHLRLEQSAYPEVTLDDAETCDSFEDARAAACHWAQQQAPPHERRHRRGVYEPPDVAAAA